jgi:hypothetical protein
MFAERVAGVAAGEPAYVSAWNELRAKLLSLGESWDVVPTFEREDLLETLLEYGELHQVEQIVMLTGEVGRCHDNVAALLQLSANGEIKLSVVGATGYALSEDGLWRQHSWGVGRNGEIYETTVARCAYFGISYTD